MNDDQSQLQHAARRLSRRISQGAIATLDRNDGEPYASFAIVAQDYDGAPTLFISKLSDHRQNLDADGRISILFDGTRGTHPPLAGERVSFQGTAELSDTAHLRRRFISRHEDAAQYAQFADFGFYRVKVSRAHLVAGFGRVHWLDRQGLILDDVDIEDWCSAEPALIDALAAKYADAFKAKFSLREGPTITGVDPDGVDLRLAAETYRLDFAQPQLLPESVMTAVRQVIDKPAETG